MILQSVAGSLSFLVYLLQNSYPSYFRNFEFHLHNASKLLFPTLIRFRSNNKKRQKLDQANM